MPQYLISVLAQDTELASPEERAAISAFNVKMQAAGQRVFAGGLGAPDTATVIDNRSGKPLVTDGPFVESKEFIAGLWIIEAGDREQALELATAGSQVCNRRVELREFV